MRGKTATLRTRHSQVTNVQVEVAKSKFAAMSAIDILKWGSQYKRNESKGWLKDALVKEKVMDGSKAATQGRFWSDLKAEDVFMQGMKACMGDTYDPRISTMTRGPGGHFEKQNGVPQNYLTVRYLMHAYDISKTTYKRMKKGATDLPKEKKHHPNKGKSIFEDKEFAAN